MVRMTGEKKYADLAASVFDTYMTGIYYRNVPKDLNHGQQQTLVGMSSLDVYKRQMPIRIGAWHRWRKQWGNYRIMSLL